MTRVMGVLEALGAIEAHPGRLTAAERAEAAALRAKRGCRNQQDRLTHAERLRLIALGRKCAEGEDPNGDT